MSTRSSPALDWLDDVRRERVRAGLRRELRPRAAGESAIDLASNDYLGLAGHPAVIEGAIRSAWAWGGGSTGSRLVTGTTAEHAELEAELACFTGHEAALVFSSGYLANLGAVVALSGPGALVVSDAGSHASLVDACRLSRARVVVTPRGDVDAVAAALAARTEDRALVITDAVHSADGAAASVAGLHRVARRHGAVLLVDEAHGVGVRGPGGRGLVAELGLTAEEDVLVTATLSKALASQGGVVLGSERLRAHLVDAARPFIFDTGLAPACVGAARAALRELVADPDLPNRVLRVSAALAAAAGVPDPGSAVVPVVLGSAERAVAATSGLAGRGIRVGCFRPPSVPEGASRLRMTARADLTDADLEVVAAGLDAVLHGVGAGDGVGAAEQGEGRE